MIRADLLTKLAKPVTLNDLGLTNHDVPTPSNKTILRAGKKYNTWNVNSEDIDYAALSADGRPLFDYRYEPTYKKYRSAGIDPELGVELASTVYDNRPNSPYPIETPKIEKHDQDTDLEWQAIAKKRMVENVKNRAKGALTGAFLGAGLGIAASKYAPKASKLLTTAGSVGGAALGQWAENKNSEWIKDNREALQNYANEYAMKSPGFKSYAGGVLKNVARAKDVALQDADEAIRVYNDLRRAGKIKDSDIERDADGVYDVPVEFSVSKFRPYRQNVR